MAGSLPLGEVRGHDLIRLGLAALVVVRDLRGHWVPASVEELERFDTDVLSGFVLARASAGLADGTVAHEDGH
ncbi:hypothetical protein [Streptomyces sp. NPDC048295]|uniref:hypothetical protein n=1 Tax=Streptomyces sp. NPDC048295 TaxID=3154617 RepID=UPI003420659A